MKSKYGTLRFYSTSVPTESYELAVLNGKPPNVEYLHGAIDFAESLSCKICEVCGKPGKAHGTQWVETLCEECLKTE